MKKQLVIIGIILILLTVGLSGCNENGFGKSNEEKILGTWGGIASGEEETSIFTFFSNGTFSASAVLYDFWSDSYTRQNIWGAYVMTEVTLAMDVKGETIAYEYSFSDDDKKLTLITVEQDVQFAVLTKYSSPPLIPSIQFLKDDNNYILTVLSVYPSDIFWSDIEITGTCDNSDLGTYVTLGDMITDCSDTITLRDKKTNLLLGTWTFTVIYESASVVVRAEASKIKITLTTGGSNYPSNGYSFEDSVTIRLNATIMAETNLAGNTGWDVGESLYIGGVTPSLDDVNSGVTTLGAGTYWIAVIIRKTVIYDDTVIIV